ncbi:hypothetical protein RRG08_011202, partial [Elysia crispata]
MRSIPARNMEPTAKIWVVTAAIAPYCFVVFTDVCRIKKRFC